MSQEMQVDTSVAAQALENLPASHSRQSDSADPPAALLYVPMPHDRHCPGSDAASVGWNVPALHRVHAVSITAVAYLPASHTVHADIPDCDP
jgi:hypothetical protein